MPTSIEIVILIYTQNAPSTRNSPKSMTTKLLGNRKDILVSESEESEAPSRRIRNGESSTC